MNFIHTYGNCFWVYDSYPYKPSWYNNFYLLFIAIIAWIIFFIILFDVTEGVLTDSLDLVVFDKNRNIFITIVFMTFIIVSNSYDHLIKLYFNRK